MLVQTKFKRLKVNAGFTLSAAHGTMALKVSETEYRPLSANSTVTKIDRSTLVWVDDFQVKPWYKF